jgi:hypothetical protein
MPHMRSSEGFALAADWGLRREDPSPEPRSGPLSRKNAFVRVMRRLCGGQRAMP